MSDYVSYGLLSGFYILSTLLILYLAFKPQGESRFSFHLLFSLIYFSNFYLGFPFTLALALGFDSPVQDNEFLFASLFMATFGYVIYYAVYQFRASPTRLPRLSVERDLSVATARITGALLMLVALGTAGFFFFKNGLLLFKLDKYSDIFSQNVSVVGLKRFFYFFLPALLVYYFLRNDKKAWFSFLAFGLCLGIFNYILVGGTRANMALSLALFFFIGIYRRYLSLVWIFVAAGLAIVGMFFLALARYGLNVSGKEALFTFLYLTRDTFAPWENFALMLNSKVEFQGLMPIVRDFYVYVPKALWQARPSFVWNTANYFTTEILDYRTGLAISPTLLGSFYLMGGIPLIAFGMGFVGLIIRAYDGLLKFADSRASFGVAALIKAFCFGNIFYLIVLVREGTDGFFSRFMFFTVIFGACLGVASLIVWLFKRTGFTKTVPLDARQTASLQALEASASK